MLDPDTEAQSELGSSISKGLSEYEKSVGKESDGAFLKLLFEVARVSGKVQDNLGIGDIIESINKVIWNVKQFQKEVDDLILDGLDEDATKVKLTISRNYFKAYRNLQDLDKLLNSREYSKTLTDFENYWANSFLSTYYMIIMNAAGVSFITDNLTAFMQIGDDEKLRANIIVCKHRLRVIVSSIGDLKRMQGKFPAEVAEGITELENKALQFIDLIMKEKIPNETVIDVADRVLENHHTFLNTIKLIYSSTLDRCFHK